MTKRTIDDIDGNPVEIEIPEPMYIKFKTESVKGSPVDLSAIWKNSGVREIVPRTGFLGSLGRMLKIRKLGWIDRKIKS